MKKTIYFNFHIGDFLSETIGMDAVEVGAYTMLLLAHYQAGEQGIPDDDKYLSRAAKVTLKVWKRIKNIVIHSFEVQGGNICQKGVIEQLRKVEQLSTQNSAKSLKRWKSSKATAKPRESYPKAQHPTSKYNPPLPPRETYQEKSLDQTEPPEQGALKNGGGESMPIGRVFRIEHLLSDNARLKAKQKCTALNRDFYNLIGVYDEGVNSGKRTAPNHPDGALLAWIDKYTKGERL